MERKNLFKLAEYLANAEYVGVAETELSVSTTDHTPTEPKTTQPEPQSAAFTCVTCKVTFSNAEERAAHYKSEWHCFNLKLRMANLKRITLEEFEKVRTTDISDMDEDVSSSSESSDTEDEQESDETRKSITTQSDEVDDVSSHIVRNASPKITFTTTTTPPKSSGSSQPVSPAVSSDALPRPNDGSIRYALSMWKAILLPKSRHSDVGSYLAAVKEVAKKDQWTILLCTGGFFAGAVFKQRECLAHRRIARYTTRRKQGGSQAARDAQGNRAIKSAGAHIRRTNEAKLREEIAETLAEWKTMIDGSHLIFLFAPSFNRHSFFYEGSPLNSNDPRIRSIPFTTRRPSFMEIKRIHELLSTVEILVAPEPTKATEVTSKQTTEIPQTPAIVENAPIAAPQPAEEDRLLAAIQRNDLEEVKRLLDEGYKRPPQEIDDTFTTPLFLSYKLGHKQLFQFLLERGLDINVPIPSEHFGTCLHVACKNADNDAILLLLNHGADPTVREIHELTPWDLTTDKNTRLLIRRYAGEHPAQWDWQKARVPILTKEMEEEKRKKTIEKRARKKQAAKERKKQEQELERQRLAEEQKKREEEERKRAQMEALRLKREAEEEALRERMKKLAGLSDREKRALAAEMRMKAASSATANICDNCGAPLVSLVPFERLNYKYCSTKCVGEHRVKLGGK